MNKYILSYTGEEINNILNSNLYITKCIQALDTEESQVHFTLIFNKFITVGDPNIYLRKAPNSGLNDQLSKVSLTYNEPIITDWSGRKYSKSITLTYTDEDNKLEKILGNPQGYGILIAAYNTVSLDNVIFDASETGLIPNVRIPNSNKMYWIQSSNYISDHFIGEFYPKITEE